MTHPATTIQAVAQAFARCLRDDLTAMALDAIIEENSKCNDDTCASHDHCDANMVMAAAMEQVLGRDTWMPCDVEEGKCTQAECDADLHLWNAAWALAKDTEFAAVLNDALNVEDTLQRNDDGTYGFATAGTAIEDPCASECSRFSVTPRFYGFAETHIDDGTTNRFWVREFGQRRMHVATDETGRSAVYLWVEDDSGNRIDWVLKYDDERGEYVREIQNQIGAV